MSTSYDVVVRLRTEGSLDANLGGANAKANALAGSLDRGQKLTKSFSSSTSDLGSIASDTFSKIGGFVSGAANVFTGAVERVGAIAATFAKVGAVAGLAVLAHGVAGVNKQLETTQISLAAIFNANGVSNFAGGMEIAKEQMAKMRADAARLPGETKDLVQIFRMASPSGFQAGASPDMLRDLSAKAMAAGKTMDLPMEQVARETAMLLQGRAGAHNVFGMDLGIKAQGFNDKSAPERLAILTKALDKFEPSIEAFSKSWEGASSTFADNLTKLEEAVTKPLFEKVKGALLSINESFARNEDSILAFASHIGEKIGAAFDVGLKHLDMWGNALGAFAENVRSKFAGVGDALGPLITRLEGVALNFLSSPASFDKIESILKLYAAIKVVGGPMLGGVASMGSSIASGGAQLAMGMGGSALEAAAIGGPAAIAAIVGALGGLAVIAVAVAGAVHALTDESSNFHGMAERLTSSIRDNLGTAFSQLSDAASALAPAAIAVADAMGMTLLIALDAVSGVAAQAAGAISSVASALGSLAAFAGIGGSGSVATGTGATEFNGFNAADLGGAIANGMKTKVGGGGGGGGTHIAKVEIVVTTNDDPSRFARRVKDVLAEDLRYPKSSRYVPNYASPR